MAISYIDRNIQEFTAAQSLTFTMPAATTTDDLILVCVKQSLNAGAQVWDDDGGGGNGYTRLAYNRSTGGRDQETAIYWKIATSGSEADPTFTWDVGGTDSPMSGALLVYRGVDTIVPIARAGYAFQQNTPAANAPAIEVDYDDSWVVLFQAVTHDDITTPGMPSGYSNRAQVWNGTLDDHKNLFVADIGSISAGSYDPPAFTHSSSSNTPESHIYAIVLNEVQPIGILTAPSSAFFSETNKTITGWGFEASQGTGKVELWSDESGTIKTTQTIDSWSDTSIQIDFVQGSLSNNTVNYLVITNDSGDVTSAWVISFGTPTYPVVVEALNADHLWKFNNDAYVDSGRSGNANPATLNTVGTSNFTADPICESTTHSMLIAGTTVRRECADSSNMNITIDSAERTVATWIKLGGIQNQLACLWKEGGGVQNLALLTGLGNVLMAQAADNPGNAINSQAVSSIKLTPNRPYHVAMRYTLTEAPKEWRLYLDGVEQPYALTNGNPLGSGSFNSHSGDIVWGDPDGNLETGGTDIAYNASTSCKYAYFCSWSDNSPNSSAGALEKVTEIRDVLFRRGAIPAYTIGTDTQVNMQSDLDTQLEDTEVEDWPLGIRVEEKTGGGDLTLTANGITFDPRTTEHLEWRGTGTLTWIVDTTSSIDEDKIFTTGGGSVTVVSEVPISVTVKDFDTGSAVENARVRMTAGAGGSETEGDVLLEGLTNASGILTGALQYSVDQPVEGRVRRATTGTRYKTSDISSTITSNGLDITLLMISDE